MITNGSKIYKIRVKYARSKNLTHSAACAVLREIVLNSGNDVLRMDSNKAWPRITFGPVLEPAADSKCEFCDIYFPSPQNAEEVKKRLNAVSKEGFEFLEAKNIPFVFPSVENLACAAEFVLEYDGKPEISKENLISSEVIEVADGKKLKIIIPLNKSREVIDGFAKFEGAKIVKENLLWRGSDGVLTPL